MTTKTIKLFGRDFTIMVLGQIISLFGNSILRFALSLYVLDLTGSAAVFGGILALSMVPTALLSPIGGVIADRLPKQKIMVALDFTTAALILLFDLLYARAGNLAAVTALMILLSLIQAFYQPSVQASIPALAADEHLMKANGVVIQVQSLATLLGPIIAGFLYGGLGLFPILATSAACFFFSAVMELFLRIPYLQKPREAGMLRQVGRDLREAFHFLAHDNPRLWKLLFILAGLNLFLSSLIMVGLPYLIKVYLGLSAQLYGFAEGAMGLGSIVGGLLSGILGSRIRFSGSYRYLTAVVLLLLPAVPALAFSLPVTAVYGILVAIVFLIMVLVVLFNITAQTYMQRQTPSGLFGKVAAFVSTISVCAVPLGQALYGALFQGFAPWIVMLAGGAASAAVVLATKKVLRGVEA